MLEARKDHKPLIKFAVEAGTLWFHVEKSTWLPCSWQKQERLTFDHELD